MTRLTMILLLAVIAAGPACVFSIGGRSKEVRYVHSESPADAEDFRTAATWLDEVTFGPHLTGDREEALSDFRAAQSAGDAADAERHLKRSVDASPSAAALNNLGCIYRHQGDERAAEASFRAALALDPDNDVIRENLEDR